MVSSFITKTLLRISTYESHPKGYESHVKVPLKIYESILRIAEQIQKIKEAVQDCHEGIQLVRSMEQVMYDLSLTSLSSKNSQNQIIPGDPGVVRLENSLLHLAALSTVTQGVFYMLPVHISNSTIVVRYMESGVYRGFFQDAKRLLAEKLQCASESIIPWQVYTDKDIQLARPKKTPTNVAKSFNSKVGGLKNSSTWCMMNLVNCLKGKEGWRSAVVHALRVGNKPNHPLGRYCGTVNKFFFYSVCFCQCK